MSIDELVCEFNVFFIEVILKGDFVEFPFFCNRDYDSYKRNSFLYKFSKSKWRVEEIELDDFVNGILKMWWHMIEIEKVDSTSIIIKIK